MEGHQIEVYYWMEGEGVAPLLPLLVCLSVVVAVVVGFHQSQEVEVCCYCWVVLEADWAY